MSGRTGLRPGLLAVAGLVLGACGPAVSVTLQRSPQSLTVRRPALYPETIEYDARRGQFLLSSFRDGAIYRVDDAGAATLLVNDARLCSVLGIAVDAQRNRLWAVTADLGASRKPSAQGPKQLAAVGVYDLTTGAPLDYVDVSGLLPGPHLLNGIALDAAGDAYVTDSFASAIYAIRAPGKASVLLRDAAFAGDGINLNGVVVHPDGYLLVVKKSDGSLFKVPLQDPARFSKVTASQRFIGGDGLTLIGKQNLLLIANQTPSAASNAAFSLFSSDGWATAKVSATEPLGVVYPTTSVLRDGKLYVVHSRLNELIQAPPEQKAQLTEEAVIQQIGRVSP